MTINFPWIVLVMAMVLIGRTYESGNLKGEEGKADWIEADPRVFYRAGGPDGQWYEYNTATKKETPINIPLL